MKKILTIAMTLFLNLPVQANTNNPLSGKTYEAEVADSCEETPEGGCMVYYYCRLSFKQDQVNVTYYEKTLCSAKKPNSILVSKEETLSYTLKNNQINIENFEYKNLRLQGDSLLAEKTAGGGRTFLFKAKK